MRGAFVSMGAPAFSHRFDRLAYALKTLGCGAKPHLIQKLVQPTFFCGSVIHAEPVQIPNHHNTSGLILDFRLQRITLAVVRINAKQPRQELVR